MITPELNRKGCRVAYPFAALAWLLLSGPAAAHTAGLTSTASFAAGFLHPFGGLDHFLAMLSVGVWAALAGGLRVWIWPAAFVGAMVTGGALALADVTMPITEPLIGGSVVLLGALVALAVVAPMWLGSMLIVVFALAHGQAHGAEAGSAALAPYMLGFVLATTLLHAIGVAMTQFVGRAIGQMAVRGFGALSALAGLAVLAG